MNQDLQLDPSHRLGREHWQLGCEARLRDRALAVRRDEEGCRDVNHGCARLDPAA